MKGNYIFKALIATIDVAPKHPQTACVSIKATFVDVSATVGPLLGQTTSPLVRTTTSMCNLVADMNTSLIGLIKQELIESNLEV